MKKINEIFSTNLDFVIKDVKTNSKEVNPGDLFVCIKGFAVDRHDFVADAEARGAAALVVSRDVDSKLPQFKVEDTNKELLNIVQKVYNNIQDKIKVVGVTGTDGKTTTSTIIYQLLNNITKAGYIGTNGIECPGYTDSSNNTTPALEQLYKTFYNFDDHGCKYAVMEAGSEGLLQGRCEGINFDFAIFTNLTHEHLNTHKTMENYLEAKATLFKQTRKEGYCIINIDDQYSAMLIPKCNGKVISYGSSEVADWYFFDTVIEKEYTSFKLKNNDKIYDIKIPLLGMFNVYNMTAALATLSLMGYEIENLEPYFENLFIDGRMNDIALGQDFKVIVDYAHTPNGYLNLFALTKTLKANRTIIVAGSAGERDAKKRPVMGEILVNNADLVVFTYEDPRSEDPSDIIDQMTSKVMDKKEKFVKIVDRHEAIEYAINVAKKDDMVLILGKGNETYEIIGKEKKPFNDVNEAKEALKKRLENQ